MRTLLIITSLLYFTHSFAGQRTYSTNFYTKKPIHELLEILTDYENECTDDCTTENLGYVEIKPLVYNFSEKEFYVWVYIDDIKDSYSFAKVTIKEEEGTTTVSQIQVPKSYGKELQKITGLKSKPLFKTANITTKLKQLKDGTSFVEHSMQLGYGMILKPFGSKVYNAIKEVSEDLKQKLLE